jgi:hypothetical protein
MAKGLRHEENVYALNNKIPKTYMNTEKIERRNRKLKNIVGYFNISLKK